MQLHRLSVLIGNPVDYLFFNIRASFLQSVRILYGRFQESSTDVYFLFTWRSKTQHDFVFAVNSVSPEFFALRLRIWIKNWC